MQQAVHLDVAGRHASIDPVVQKLSQLGNLSDEDIDKVLRLARRPEFLEPGEEIAGESRPSRCRAIISGWGARIRELPDGRRQIFAFLVPGDIVGIRAPGFADSSIIAMTRVEVVDLTLLREDLDNDSSRTALHEACSKAAQLDERLLLNHIVRLGRQTASQRLAHMLLELGERVAIATAGDPSQFSLPVTQENLADALGLSLVHMNRTIQMLRRQELLRLKGRTVSLLKRDQLMSLASFSPIHGERPSVVSERRSWSDYM